MKWECVGVCWLLHWPCNLGTNKVTSISLPLGSLWFAHFYFFIDSCLITWLHAKYPHLIDSSFAILQNSSRSVKKSWIFFLLHFHFYVSHDLPWPISIDKAFQRAQKVSCLNYHNIAILVSLNIKSKSIIYIHIYVCVCV